MNRLSWISARKFFEPDEVGGDPVAGVRVGEAEVDAAHERRDAEDEDRQHRRDEQQSASRAREADARHCRGGRGSGRAGRPGSGIAVTRTLLRRSRGRRGAAGRRRSRTRRVGCSIRLTSSSAASRPRRAGRVSTLVSARVHDARRGRCCPCPRLRRRRAPQGWRRAARPARRSRCRSFAQKIASGLARSSSRTVAARPGSTVKSSPISTQALVELEADGAETVGVAGVARARPAVVSRGPLTKRDPAPARSVQVADGRLGAHARLGRDGVDRGLGTRPADHDDRHRRAAERARRASRSSGARRGSARRRTGAGAPGRSRALSARSPPVECRTRRRPLAPTTSWIERDHRRVDGVRDVGHRERDLARLPRAERAGRGVRDVADRARPPRSRARRCRASCGSR